MIISQIKVQDLAEIFAMPTALNVKDTDVRVLDDGLELMCIDPSHVAMASVRAYLDVANAEDDDEIVNIEIGALNEALGKFAKTDLVDVFIRDGKVTIKAEKSKRTFRLNAPSETKPPRIPELDLEVKVSVPLTEIRKAVKFGGDIGDHYTIDSLGGVLAMTTEGDEGCSATYEFGPCEDSVRVMIQSDYMSNVIKAMPTAEEITLEMTTDYPMRFRADNGTIEVMALIAPRIENDD